MAAAGIAVPPNVEHVAIDFEATSLVDGLATSGFDPRAATFVSWLGVMVYLTESAVDAVFAFVAALPSPSEIVFTFTAPKGPDESDEIAERAAAAGERDALRADRQTREVADRARSDP